MRRHIKELYLRTPNQACHRLDASGPHGRDSRKEGSGDGPARLALCGATPGRDGFALVAAAGASAPVALVATVRAAIGAPTSKHLGRLMEGPFQVAVPGTHQALFCHARGVISGLPARD